jgi:hypothetical protein
MLKILLVEDDHLQCSYIRQALADSLDAIVATKTCEWEFTAVQISGLTAGRRRSVSLR